MTGFDYASAPLISSDPATRYAAIQAFWHDIHRFLNVTHKTPGGIIEEILAITGQCLGADRTYTFSVTTDRACTSCTHEWTSRPEFALKPLLQNIDQRHLRGWLTRFDSSNAIVIENVENPPEDLVEPAAKFKRDSIRSIYVFGFHDGKNLIGYLGVDYVTRAHALDELALDILYQLASTLNLFILRHETLELWNRTAEALPSALFIKDADNDLRYSYANPRYRQIYGENIVGMDDIEAFGPETGRQFRAQDRELLATRKPFAYNGPQIDFSKIARGFYALVKFPVSTEMGRHYVAGFITDITAEHELRMQALELLEKTKAAERAKSLFLASMSHEIRTPLNAIIGLVDELRHNDLPDETRNDYLSSVSTASHALLALINDVLDMTKIEAGKMPIMPVETDMAALFGECEAVFGETSRKKGLTLECRLSAGFPHVMLDAMRVKQILFNLLGNAVKFTHVGGISLTGGFTRGNAGTGTLSLSVADTGIGIAQEEQAKVFELFEQAKAMRGTRVANSGTGLGLCLCKRLAKCLNGDIALESTPGEGSTFTVTLREVPFVETAKAGETSPRAAAAAASGNAPSALRGRVLIVDDVPMNLKVLGLVLRRAGIEPIAANGGADALEKLNAGGIAYVLTDMWMPEINGEDLARKIRGNPEWKHIRIAAQTADVEATSNFDASLFDAVLSKPITAAKVLAFLSEKA